MVEAVSLQPAGHDTHRHCCPALGKLVANSAGGPPAGGAPVLDEAHRLGAGPGVAAKRVARHASTERYGGSCQRGVLLSEGCFSTTHPGSRNPAAPGSHDL